MPVRLGKDAFNGVLPENGDRVTVVAQVVEDDAGGFRLNIREVQKGKDVLLRAKQD
ncbi:MAG: hypothetical protein RDV41_14745 [Planctomycetota bacterium]|nr:hypothetical protein [Planctomycetota bacterium]